MLRSPISRPRSFKESRRAPSIHLPTAGRRRGAAILPPAPGGVPHRQDRQTLPLPGPGRQDRHHGGPGLEQHPGQMPRALLSREIMWGSRARWSPTRGTPAQRQLYQHRRRPPGPWAGPQDFDPELLLQTTPYDRQELWRELRQLAEDHIQPPVGELVLRLLDRYQDLLLVCPAARLYHHPYLGGLLEHTWFVARHTLASLSHLSRPQPGSGPGRRHPPRPGQSQGDHQPHGPGAHRGRPTSGPHRPGLGDGAGGGPGLEFPDPDLLIQLEHIILAHHGALEFGSPIVPKTREALLVNVLDDLDAKLKMMSQHLESDTG